MFFVVAELEEACIHDEQCSESDEYSMCGSADTCECQTGYVKTDDGCLEGNFIIWTSQHETSVYLLHCMHHLICSISNVFNVERY